MDYQQYTYPPALKPYKTAYNGQFESVYVILNPFIELPKSAMEHITPIEEGGLKDIFEEHGVLKEIFGNLTEFHQAQDGNTFSNAFYVDNQELIATHGQKCSWQKIIELCDFKDTTTLNHALESNSGGMRDKLRDLEAAGQLNRAIDGKPIFYPERGFPEQLLPDIESIFSQYGEDSFIFVPDIPLKYDYITAPFKDLNRIAYDDGTLMQKDAHFLFTADWDTFYFLFYGPKSFVQKMVEEHSLEGFFLSEKHDSMNLLLPPWVRKVAEQLWEQDANAKQE